MITREQSEKSRKRTHKIQGNGCTEQFTLRPIRKETLIFWRDEGNDKHEIEKGKDDRGSLVNFNTRQEWAVYYFSYGDQWNCEWKNLTLRLHRKDFERIFGKVNGV